MARCWVAFVFGVKEMENDNATTEFLYFLSIGALFFLVFINALLLVHMVDVFILVVYFEKFCFGPRIFQNCFILVPFCHLISYGI